MIEVVLVDDQAVIRAGFRILLEENEDITVVGEASGGVPSGDATSGMPFLSQRADTAVFRVAQQSISNALQHAPGAPITVEVKRLEDSLELSVLNGPARRPSTDPGGGGTGLAVMRERTDAVGGSLHAGPVKGGGWRVRLVLPLAREEDA